MGENFDCGVKQGLRRAMRSEQKALSGQVAIQASDPNYLPSQIGYYVLKHSLTVSARADIW
jgi:hypothetical protein